MSAAPPPPSSRSTSPRFSTKIISLFGSIGGVILLLIIGLTAWWLIRRRSRRQKKIVSNLSYDVERNGSASDSHDDEVRLTPQLPVYYSQSPRTSESLPPDDSEEPRPDSTTLPGHPFQNSSKSRAHTPSPLNTLTNASPSPADILGANKSSQNPGLGASANDPWEWPRSSPYLASSGTITSESLPSPVNAVFTNLSMRQQPALSPTTRTSPYGSPLSEPPRSPLPRLPSTAVSLRTTRSLRTARSFDRTRTTLTSPAASKSLTNLADTPNIPNMPSISAVGENTPRLARSGTTKSLSNLPRTPAVPSTAQATLGVTALGLEQTYKTIYDLAPTTTNNTTASGQRTPNKLRKKSVKGRAVAARGSTPEMGEGSKGSRSADGSGWWESSADDSEGDVRTWGKRRRKKSRA